MILIDTSVWVDHLRRRSLRLEQLLLDHEVCCHPFVIGELACGNLKNRDEVLGLLRALPVPHTLGDDEALAFIDAHALYARGIGWIDVHLLGAAVLGGASLWTLDRALRAAATRLGMAATFH